MTSHPGEIRLGDYADGLLSADDAGAVEAHLATCGACRRRVELMQDLMGELRALPREIEPPRELRPAVVPRGDGRAREPRRAMHSGRDRSAASPMPRVAGHVSGRRLAGQAPAPPLPGSASNRRPPGLGAWLRAAAVIVGVLLGGAAVVWLVVDRPADRETAAIAGRPAGGDSAAVAADVPLEPYSDAVRELLATFQARRDELAPEAVRLIHRNLAVVDAAIRELERARSRAPDDATLSRLLEARYRVKLELLRDAVALLSNA